MPLNVYFEGHPVLLIRMKFSLPQTEKDIAQGNYCIIRPHVHGLLPVTGATSSFVGSSLAAMTGMRTKIPSVSVGPGRGATANFAFGVDFISFCSSQRLRDESLMRSAQDPG